ncbi:MAG: hypothetical protein CME88_03115 [Hirschia sp.]|nr:hypothetical protein [Hirschia sp.]MBF17350.1 hypothetical protein [Hirschia sp.]|tara:strand:+ start:327 stop:773 length:447 start_codon:yes stop_codon:yes gene_type:complete
MSEMMTQPKPATPMHLWVVGILAVLWNGYGAFDYVMTKTQNVAYMANFTEEQIAHWQSMPLMANVGWGLGVWGAFIGSLLLLLRSKWAVQSFRLSVFGVILSTIYTYFMSNGFEMGGVGGAIFWAIICLITLGLMAYAQSMVRSGVLR